MIMHKAVDPRDDFDRLYKSMKDGGRGRVSIEDNFDASIQRLEVYIEKRRERLVTSNRNKTDNTRINRTEITGKQNKKKMGRKTTLLTF